MSSPSLSLDLTAQFPMPTNEALSRAIADLIPRDQWQAVFTANPYVDAEINEEFLGFLTVYWHLAQLIPTHWTVIDLGSGYNAQAWIFHALGHRHYVSVDSFPDIVRFHTPTSTHYTMSIGEFLRQQGHAFNPKETFAICSYCPMWGEGTTEHIRTIFPNLFVYYPHHRPEDSPFTRLKTKRSQSLVTESASRRPS